MEYRAHWVKITVLALALLGAVGYLFISGMKESMVYYLTLEEFDAGSLRAGEGVRLAGWVKENSIAGSVLEGEVFFTITDGQRDLAVRYAGPVPDTFESGAEVIVEGIYKGAPVFEATTMLAKCPSKYESAGPVMTGNPDP